MTTIGETLRSERLEQGLDLQQISESTKIGTRMLQAMEQNDFSKLPGGVFTRSFIKQYAAVLGLNPADIEEHLSRLQFDAEEAPRTETRKAVIPDRSHYSLSDYKSAQNSGSLLLSLLWVAVAMLVGGGVYYLTNRPRPAAAQPPAAAPAKTESATLPSPPPAAPVEQTPDAATNPVQPVQVELTATENAWISVSADGLMQYAGELKPEEKRLIQAQRSVRLVSGNAGALAITLNGKPVDSIGPKGQVRVVEFTPEGAHVVPRAPRPAALP